MEKSGFFNSNNGDRVYNANDFAEYFGDLVSNGIFYKNADNLQVIAANDMNITVQSGSAWINGYHYSNSMPMNLPISTANGINPRIDRVVLRWDNVARSINLAVKDGVPSSNPTPPDLTRNTDTWELALANVFVNRSVMSIDSASISDLRLNSDLCD